MGLVDEYWNGVLRRLEAEVEAFNALIPHQGEKGRENELSLARVLERLVPSRYGIGSGLLIDAQGGFSKQMDIVIFDQVDEPAFLAQTNQLLFPVENVRACIEVKTTIDSTAIKDAKEKRASIRTLAPKGEKGLPLFALVGFRSTVTASTVATNLNSLDDNGDDSRPDLVCVLGLALLGLRQHLAVALGLPIAADYMVGVAALQKRVNSVPQPGDYREAPDDGSADVNEGGVVYPVVTIEGNDVLAEASRALLLFSTTLLTALALDEGRTPPTMHHYVTPAARDLYLL
jgi:hypothetical protein